MTPSFVVPVLLAVALLLAPAPAGSARARLASALTGDNTVPTRSDRPLLKSQLSGPVLATAVGLAFACGLGGITGAFWGITAAVAVWWCHRLMLRQHDRGRCEPLLLAAGWDLLAAGMRAGLPVPVTLRAVAEEFTGTAAQTLREVADLFALGADPVSAWEPALQHPDTGELARAARRTARTGSGLADAAGDVAKQARESLGEAAQVRAQRAAVWVSAPLGVCFLPAFLCLGVVPVVVGMVEQLRVSW